jgi:hypothetical protein
MIVSELQYFPPLSFFPVLYTKSYVKIDIYEDYRKMSFRNRCDCRSAGIISLSVPLREGRNQRLPMNEVLISNSEKWQARHFNPSSRHITDLHFEYYQDELAVLYQQPFNRLAEWNLHCLNWLKKKMEWPAEIHFTDAAIPFHSEGVDDRRNRVLPKYSDLNPVKYRQVFEERTGYFPNLSILDLLFNTGKEAGNY